METPAWEAVPMFAQRADQIGRDAALAEMAKLATPLGRYAKPHEIAAQIAFLPGDDAVLITGHACSVMADTRVNRRVGRPGLGAIR